MWCVLSTVWQAASSTFAFHKVVRQHCSGEVRDFIYFDVTFHRNILNQNLLKSIPFLTSYSTYKEMGAFLRQCTHTCQ